MHCDFLKSNMVNCQQIKRFGAVNDKLSKRQLVLGSLNSQEAELCFLLNELKKHIFWMKEETHELERNKRKSYSWSSWDRTCGLSWKSTCILIVCNFGFKIQKRYIIWLLISKRFLTIRDKWSSHFLPNNLNPRPDCTMPCRFYLWPLTYMTQ